MTVPKAKTLIERFGFNDPELTTPEHDEMFIVCMNSVQKIVDLVVESDKRFSTWRRMVQNLDDGQLLYASGNHDDRSPYIPFAKEEYLYTSQMVTPEKPITSGNNFIIGFIDVFIHAKLGVCLVDDPMSPFKSHVVYGGYNAKMEDIYDYNLDEIDNIPIDFNIMIEIKPSIQSAGELIRQMQTYRQYAKGDVVFVVISKTTGFKDILAQADIMLINYSDILPSK